MDHNHLAWHETLELHELVVFQSVGLMKLKKFVNEVECPTLQKLYITTIAQLEQNLKELLKFYPMAPDARENLDDWRAYDKAFYSGDLLAFAKTAVRNYAIAITETATPILRDVLTKQLQVAIKLHASVYNYMYERDYYPSYDLSKLLANDIKLANKAISLNS
ncbi:spore coat protein [Bacillus luteolus]|uniref:Spore coat protein n=1 Tax=Litchfieldia luteola TaxID=682179 RepID=A0ABR9QNC2_9BACI|nr:spore coat protein [Cytobacillus luteolus]MBE4910005.1 spore coat protein [Cytobacillus luteolus]MBP1942435.1 spore coat protein F [Cytobacillus luteolus]